MRKLDLVTPENEDFFAQYRPMFGSDLLAERDALAYIVSEARAGAVDVPYCEFSEASMRLWVVNAVIAERGALRLLLGM